MYFNFIILTLFIKLSVFSVISAHTIPWNNESKKDNKQQDGRHANTTDGFKERANSSAAELKHPVFFQPIVTFPDESVAKKYNKAEIFELVNKFDTEINTNGALAQYNISEIHGANKISSKPKQVYNKSDVIKLSKTNINGNKTSRGEKFNTLSLIVFPDQIIRNRDNKSSGSLELINKIDDKGTTIKVQSDQHNIKLNNSENEHRKQSTFTPGFEIKDTNCNVTKHNSNINTTICEQINKDSTLHNRFDVVENMENGLDDRVSLSGDKCPTGQVKLVDKCVPVD